MRAVVFPNSWSLAVQQRSLLALTLHVIQQDPDAAVCLSKCSSLQDRQGGFEAQLPTHYGAGFGCEKVVTDCPPLTTDKDLNPASIG